MSTAPTATRADAAARWLVLHGWRDALAAPLAQALADVAPAGVRVQTLALPALLADARLSLHVAADGVASCGLSGGAPIALVNRCPPMQLSAGVPDAAYKDAEWHAIITAWLHALPGRVANRPRVGWLWPGAASRARWCQLAAVHGLPTWPVSSGDAWSIPARARSGLLVVGERVFQPESGPSAGWPVDARRAAAAAASAAGCTMLAWLGCPDAHGTWRIVGADSCPDWRPYGSAAVAALADWLAGDA